MTRMAMQRQSRDRTACLSEWASVRAFGPDHLLNNRLVTQSANRTEHAGCGPHVELLIFKPSECFLRLLAGFFSDLFYYYSAFGQNSLSTHESRRPPSIVSLSYFRAGDLGWLFVLSDRLVVSYTRAHDQSCLIALAAIF